jgi:hypothetical protein
VHRGFDKNEYGTEISLHTCDVCGQDFTLTPSQKRDEPCGTPDCKSYDENRDVELLLENGAKLEKFDIQ